jgi:hypothetical protein
MNFNKNLLLVVAIIGIGLFVLPSTLSMFAGQHSWYNPENNGIPCQKCHFLEEEELAASGGPHDPDYSGLLNASANYTGIVGEVGGTDFWGGSTELSRCYGCHQTTGTENASSPLYDTWATQNDTVHAAVAVWCIDCHPWVESELNNSNAAHRDFYVDLNTSGTSLLQKPNQACLGCHTHVGVNISWTRAEFVSYNISVNTTSQSYEVEWNTSDTLGENTSRFNSTPG